MEDRSEERSAAASPAPRPPADERPGGPLLTVLRLTLIGMVLVAGMALASPGARRVATEEPEGCQVAAAPQSVVVLPPGHPPIRGLESQGRAAMALPPGHPPIDGPGMRAIPARPFAPLFSAPETVDL